MTDTPDGNAEERGAFRQRDEASPPLCFIVDDEVSIARFIALALKGLGIACEQFGSVDALRAGLDRRHPQLIFLDISLGDSDAIDAIRLLAERRYGGTVQLMSGRDSGLLRDVRLIGERHGLAMLPALNKPFRVDAIRRTAEEQGLAARTPPAPAGARAEEGAPPVPFTPKVSLSEALRHDWLELWYQPKMDLRRRIVTGAEGLARIRHPEHGLIAPNAFIPSAGKDVLLALSERVLHMALRDSYDFERAGFALQLAINVPAEALLKLPIPAIVRAHRAERSGWTGIVLEVTEDQAIRDIPLAHEIATQLRIYGVKLAIDDFGRGYSSLARLKDLPFAELKLDQSFVQNCGTDPTNAALCATAVELAHRFGSVAVAEGIETTEDLAAIMRVGCDVAQGFLFAHPMPKEFLLARLKGEGPDGGFGRAFATAAGEERESRFYIAH